MMKGMTGWSFRNKAAMKVGVIMALLIGVLSYLTLPMEFLPNADNPAVTITAIGQGFDAKSMETAVTEPLEKAVTLVKGKKDMLSTTGNGFSRIDLAFDSKTDMKAAKAEVQEMVDSVRLPAGVLPPFVIQLNTSMIPVSWVSISFQDGLTAENMKLAEDRILPEIQKIKGAGDVSIYGKTTPTVTVTADPAKLEKAQVPFASLMGVLQGKEQTTSIGERTIDGSTGNVKVVGHVRDIDSLKKLQVGAGTTLGDVADVKLQTGQESVSRVGGQEIMLITVSKAAGANAVDVGHDVQAAADRLTQEIPGAQVSVMSSTADMVVDSVNGMMREVLLGALFATAVILLFLRNLRTTFITIVSIPLSLAITLYLLNFSGVTLNIITLGGVAVAVGRLVDDSIVVIENIYRRLQKEAFSTDLIIGATKEVASAITTSTITTVAVFLPMGLLRGSLQAFLLPFALTVTYSLLTSLVVALTVVPLLSSVMLRNTKMAEHEQGKRFTGFLRWNLSNKWVPLTVAAVLFAGSIGIYVSMPKGAIDSSSAQSLTVTLDYPSDTPEEKVLAEGKKLEAFLLQQPEPKWVMMQYGNSSESAKGGTVMSPTQVSFMLEMKKDVNAEKLIENVKGQRSSFPGAELNAGALDFASGASSTEIYIDITGDDPAKLNEAAGKVMDEIRSVDGVLKVNSNVDQKKPVYTFDVNPSQANAQEIAGQLQGMLNPMPIGSMQLNGQLANVVLNPIVNPTTQSGLNGLTVRSGDRFVPISTVATLTKTEEAATLYHKEGKPYVRVTATVEPSQLSLAGDEITKRTKTIAMPDRTELHVGGASADQSEDFADLGMTALISICIVYLIMVIAFKTLRAPLAILFSLPLAAIGAVLGLLVTGVTPDFTVMFGALMLIGIVVTNAIVLIDRVKMNEERMPIREALLEAAASRMRPILMTAIATICAMLPLVFGKAESGSIVSQSLAIVVIGGLTAATLLTLVIVPCIYELFFFRKSRRQRQTMSAAA